MYPENSSEWFERPVYDKLLEIILSLLVVGILLGVAFPYYSAALIKTISAEAMMVSATGRLAVHEHYAMTGRWLSQSNVQEQIINNENLTIEINQGAATVVFPESKQLRLKGKKLTYRPVVQPNELGMTIEWICGYTQISDHQVIGIDSTDILAENLPWHCRKKLDN
ncbi:MAG: pilin [Candidatus Thiodiazotropha sp.]